LVAHSIASAQGQDPGREARRVVILNATDPYLPAFLALDGALREAVRAGSEVPAEFFAETLDMHRFPRKLLDQDVAALLRKKYRDLKVDVVVADAVIALEFAQRYRTEIWPGAAIVFNSVPAVMLRDRTLDARTIGVPVRLEFEQAIDLALRLRPAARSLVVISGTAEPDERHLSLARDALENYTDRMDVQYLVGLTTAELVSAVQQLPADAVVLYLTVFRDGAGAPQVPREVLERIAAASRAPVFGMFETYLGHGVAAGSITSYAAQGRRAGELVARLLNGEDPSAIGVQEPVVPECIADWRELRRWGIDESLLPEGCEVRFRGVTAWDRYHWQILSVLVVIVVQGVLIIVLILNRRRLRYARVTLDEENTRRIHAEGLAAQLRGRLEKFSKQRSLGTMASFLSHEINQPLIAIQNYAQAARRRLERDSDEKSKLIELVSKIEGQAERAGAITRRVRSLVNSGEPQLAPTSIHPLIEEVIRLMEPEVERCGCLITGRFANDLPTVLADSLEVQLVLVNLLQNAMQAICPTNQSDKSLSIDVCSKSNGEVQVSLTDRGPGVPPDKVADIFEPLYSGTDGGMGMGLAIARTIVEAHGGRLWYEANPLGGAIFRFTLQAVKS